VGNPAVSLAVTSAVVSAASSAVVSAASSAVDSAAGTALTWAVGSAGRVVGTVTLLRTGDHVAELTWSGAEHAELAELEPLRQGLNLAVARAFDELGLHRVEARIPTDDVTGLRAAALAGLRREGVLRGAATDGSDEVVLGRLAGDPAVSSRDGFIALLNAGLPTKRVIAHGVLRDPAGRVLLCELTYKEEWDLPGGVVEPGESPREGVVREVREELGLAVAPLRLLTVNWLRPWRGWDDACVFVFDLGVHDPSLVHRLALQPAEIAAARWCDAEAVVRRGAAATGGLLAFLTASPHGAAYLEGGVDPLGEQAAPPSPR